MSNSSGTLTQTAAPVSAAPPTVAPNASGVSSELAKKAMIVTLSTSNWSGRVKDKIATDELLDQKAAEANSGSFTKSLIDKKDLKDIRSAISEMRAYHNEQTLAWDNNGGRLLPSVKFSQYTMKLRECQRALDAAVAIFFSNYNNYIADSSHRLGNLFNQDDYPPQNELTEKFCLTADFEKVSESDDFRVEIPEFEKIKIKKQIEEKVEERHAEAMERLWKRIFDTVGHMAERLSDEDAIFRDSLIENLESLVSVLPELNILGDQKLTDLTKELENGLCGFTAEELRGDKDLRKDVAEKSKDIMDQIGSIYSQQGTVTP